MFTATAGELFPVSSNAKSDACGVKNDGNALKSSARVDWVVPYVPTESTSTYVLKVYVLQKGSGRWIGSWYNSTYIFQVGLPEPGVAAGGVLQVGQPKPEVAAGGVLRPTAAIYIAVCIIYIASKTTVKTVGAVEKN